ncbi:MAG TPA: protein phosphatase 2C domain-containing protein [Ktedonobacterales bacterium]
MEREIVVLASDQWRDELLTAEWGAGNHQSHARLLALRCQEARTQGLPGQDYARLVAPRAGGSLAFCVADGVGQSYQGDFAARLLSERLVDWLDGLDSIPASGEAVRDTLAPLLGAWAEAGQAALLAQPVRAESVPLVREVLEELRATEGSAAVFVAGRVDTATDLGADIGAAEEPGRASVLLCWLGNVAAQVYAGGARVPLDGFDDERSWWSTARGRKGTLGVAVLSLARLERLLVYSDGLRAIQDQLPALAGDAAWTEAQRLLVLPANDDMTLLDVWWSAPA